MPANRTPFEQTQLNDAVYVESDEKYVEYVLHYLLDNTFNQGDVAMLEQIGEHFHARFTANRANRTAESLAAEYHIIKLAFEKFVELAVGTENEQSRSLVSRKLAGIAAAARDMKVEPLSARRERKAYLQKFLKTSAFDIQDDDSIELCIQRLFSGFIAYQNRVLNGLENKASEVKAKWDLLLANFLNHRQNQLNGLTEVALENTIRNVINADYTIAGATETLKPDSHYQITQAKDEFIKSVVDRAKANKEAIDAFVKSREELREAVLKSCDKYDKVLFRSADRKENCRKLRKAVSDAHNIEEIKTAIKAAKHYAIEADNDANSKWRLFSRNFFSSRYQKVLAEMETACEEAIKASRQKRTHRI